MLRGPTVTPVSTATYRERLRREGLTLAGCGLAACAVLLAAAEGATDRAASTAGQMLVVLTAMTILGLRSVRAGIRDARPVAAADAGTGEPTPLWQLPVIVAVLAVAFGLLAGPDAALRIGGGSAIVGLVQAVVLERVVAAAERRTGRRHLRVAGSRILRGSRLAYLA